MSKKAMPDGPKRERRRSSARWPSVRRPVRTKWDDVRQPGLHALIAKGESVHLHIGEAPLGPELEHDGPSACILQLRDAAHRREPKFAAAREFAARFTPEASA